MTTQEKLEAIRQACIRSNPEIVELKRGCYFKWNHDMWQVNCEKCEGLLFAFSCSGDKHSWPPEMGAGPHWDYKYRHFNQEEQSEFEIIGRPTRLADVLLAIMHTEHHVCISSNERFELLNEKGEWVQQFKTWYLHNDDLSQQSPETIDFLYDLLIPATK